MDRFSFNAIGTNVYVDKGVSLGQSVTIGHASCVGYAQGEYDVTTVGDRVSIGAFCVISLGVTIADDVEIDHYCRVSGGSSIGQKSKILYGVQVFDGVHVGNNCIIGGDLIDRTVVEDDVTYMGHMAHSYRSPGTVQDWDTMVQPSPVIRYRSVVGERALVIGGITIGPEAYVAAGEIVRFDVPPRNVLYKGKLSPLESWRGLIKVRS